MTLLTKKWHVFFLEISSMFTHPTYLDCLDSILNLVDATLGGEGVDPTIVLLFAAVDKSWVRIWRDTGKTLLAADC